MKNKNNYQEMADRLGLSFRKPEKTPQELRNKAYAFFPLHMLLFAVGGFVMAYYGDHSPWLLYFHGGIACAFFIYSYIESFGIDEVKWMLTNGALGMFGVYAQIGWILSIFGAEPSDYSWWRHVIPGLYIVMYTFLFHQLALDLAKARDKPFRKNIVNGVYVGGLTVSYSLILFAQYQ